MSDAKKEFNAAWPGVKKFHDHVAARLAKRQREAGWGVDLRVGDLVECAALPVKNHGYFIVVEVREDRDWGGDYTKVRVVHALSRHPVDNNPMEFAYHFRKVDPVTALAVLGGDNVVHLEGGDA